MQCRSTPLHLCIFIFYTECPLCSCRMEMSHSMAEARVSTEYFPTSFGLEPRLYHEVSACLRGCFDGVPQLWRSARGSQSVSARSHGTVGWTLRDPRKGQKLEAGRGGSRTFRSTGRHGCRSTHQHQVGKSLG